MEETGFFKTAAFGGFDKKSVLTYIDTLNQKYHALEEDSNQKLSEYAKAQESQLAHIKRLEEQLEQQDEKLAVLAQEIEKERENSKKAQASYSQLAEQNQELQKKAADSERELQIQLERGRQLQFKAESLDYKSKKYDELTSQIGDAMVEAKRNADAVIAQAKVQASDITRQAHAYMQNFYSELGSFKGDSARLRKSIEEILFVLNDRIDSMQEVVRQIEARFEQNGDALKYTEESDTEPFDASNEDGVGYFGGENEQNVSN